MHLFLNVKQRAGWDEEAARLRAIGLEDPDSGLSPVSPTLAGLGRGYAEPSWRTGSTGCNLRVGDTIGPCHGMGCPRDRAGCAAVWRRRRRRHGDDRRAWRASRPGAWRRSARSHRRSGSPATSCTCAGWRGWRTSLAASTANWCIPPPHWRWTMPLAARDAVGDVRGGRRCAAGARAASARVRGPAAPDRAPAAGRGDAGRPASAGRRCCWPISAMASTSAAAPSPARRQASPTCRRGPGGR